MKDLGIIGPSPAGRWIWPFREMEIGDVFHVEPQTRPLHEVRTIAYCRGYQLGVKFSVTKGQDGMARVERVDGSEAYRDRFTPFISYQMLRRRLRHVYRLTDKAVDGLPWSFLETGQSHFHKAGRYQVVKQRDLIAVVAYDRFHVELQDDGFTITKVEPDMTLQDFLKQREERMVLELMG